MEQNMNKSLMQRSVISIKLEKVMGRQSRYLKEPKWKNEQ